MESVSSRVFFVAQLTQELPGTPGDTVMQGLDSLAQRCKEYKARKPAAGFRREGREGGMFTES